MTNPQSQRSVRKRYPEITQARARELFIYDTNTGDLIRRRTAGNSGEGKVIRTTSSKGYYRVMIDGHRYFVHQVVWVHQTGAWPSDQIDHIDNNRTNNRIENLRVCNCSQNMLNQRRPRVTNKLGLMGVHRLPSGKYRAQACVEGKKLNLGLFTDATQAAMVYKQFKESIV